MRVAVAVALLIFLAAPLALAQPGPAPSPGLSLRIDPWPDALVPLSAPSVTTARVHLACDASAAGQTIHVTYEVTRAPAWAALQVTPQASAVDGTRCAQAQGADLAIQIAATVSDQAPAFAPETVSLFASLDEPLHASAQTTAVAPLSAGFLSVLDVQAPETVRKLPAGGITVFPVDVTNLGNGNTKVTFEAESSSANVTAVVPAPILLQSKQTGGTLTGAVVPFQVHRRAGTPASESAIVTLRWRSAYALKADLAGESGSLSFAISGAPGDGGSDATSSAFDEAKRVPALDPGLLALAVVAVALVARQRQR